MASCDCGSVFIGDVVTCDGVDDYAVIYAKVVRFIKVVGINYFYSTHHSIYGIVFTCRKENQD